MNSSTAFVETVQQLYAAFGRGDVPALLAALAEDVDWHLNVDPAAPGAAAVPDFRRFRGRRGVGEFFAALARDLEFHSFEPRGFLTGGHEVAVRVSMELTVKRTGRRASFESIHLFTFDPAGRVSCFVEYIDTLGLAAAWGAVRATG
ncbi:MAG: nuclear transport factor 2 family protein [Verrucomicrobia bacterium]|nr:nuclear transport factor 2 family protein [Verrucomicrobiota bacterium]